MPCLWWADQAENKGCPYSLVHLEWPRPQTFHVVYLTLHKTIITASLLIVLNKLTSEGSSCLILLPGSLVLSSVSI